MPCGRNMHEIARGDAQGLEEVVGRIGERWYRRIFLIGVCVLLLADCNARQERMQTALDAYVGRSVAEFVADHGDPTSSVKLSNTETAFRWVITGQGVGAVVPIGGSLIVAPPTQRVCTVTVRATTQTPNPELKDWIIQGWNWQGAC